MANILILTLVFPPDNVSTAHIFGDIAGDLSSLGHSVTVLTTIPHYNKDLEAESQQPLRRFWGPLLKRSNYRGIPVFHALMPRKGSNVFMRLLAWANFHILSTFFGSIFISRPDIIITPSPPLTIGISAWLIGKLRGAQFIYNVQEIYPDIAIRLGAVRNGLAIRFLYALEKYVYNKAAIITVLAPKMRQNLLNKQVPAHKVKIVPNFVDIEDLRPLPKTNPFSQGHLVQDKFVVSYAGNLGVPQGLDTFLEAAQILRNESNIKFMMVGDGMQREHLRRRIESLGIKEFILLPHQPFSLVPQIYAASDVNLVPQTKEAGFEAVPSKIYRIMACGRPVIAVTDLSSDLARLVIEAKCGLVVRPGSALELANSIIWAYENQKEWNEIGKKGRAFITQGYTREIITQCYDRLIRNVLTAEHAD